MEREREKRRVREESSEEEGKKEKGRYADSEMTNLIGTCLAEDKGREPRSTKDEEKGRTSQRKITWKEEPKKTEVRAR